MTAFVLAGVLGSVFFVLGIIVASIRLRPEFIALRDRNQALAERLGVLVVEKKALERQLEMPDLEPDAVVDVLRSVQIGPKIPADTAGRGVSASHG